MITVGGSGLVRRREAGAAFARETLPNCKNAKQMQAAGPNVRHTQTGGGARGRCLPRLLPERWGRVEREAMKKIGLMMMAAGLAAMVAPDASAKEMLVCGFGSNSVARYDMNGNFLGNLDSAGNLSGPLAARMGPDGKIYVVSEGNNRIVRYSASSGAFIDTFVSDAGMNSPTGVTWDKNGDMYVSSFAGSKVRKYSGATGAFLSDFVTAGSGGLSGADNGMMFGPDGNLYVPSYNNNRVIKYNGTTGAAMGNFIASVNRPRQFEWFNGVFYVASEGANAIRRFNGTTGVSLGAWMGTGAGGLNTPIGMAFGYDGFLYVGSGGTNQILKYDAVTGAFVGVFATGNAGTFQLPAFITIIPGPGGIAVMGLAGVFAVRRRR